MASQGSGNPLTLNASVNPEAICVEGLTFCRAGPGTARVSLEVRGNPDPGGSVIDNASSVQLLFLVETTPIDGALDGDSGYGWGISDMIYRMVHNASEIAGSIGKAHPGVIVTFGLAHFAEGRSLGDVDGPLFTVDIGQFINATDFGTNVTATFGQKTNNGSYIGDADFSDSIIQSESIPALYGALNTSSLNWSNSSQRVVVLLTSAAPVDPHYAEDFCALRDMPGTSCTGATCSAEFNFSAGGSSPPCERWLTNQTDPNGSIGGIAQNGSTCRAVGCVVDIIDVNDSATNPDSPMWTNRSAGLNGTQPILRAGCDLSNFSGGSWDGPSFNECNGRRATLLFAGRSLVSRPSPDPTLLGALANVSFGAGPTRVADSSSNSTFRYVLPNVFRLAPNPNFTAWCSRGPRAPIPECPALPQVSTSANSTILEWNWSRTSTTPSLYAGYDWQAGFDIETTSYGSGTFPLLECGIAGCGSTHFGSSAYGAFSGTEFLLPYNGTPVIETFPAIAETVEGYSPLSLTGISTTPHGSAPLTVTFGAIRHGGVGNLSVSWTIAGLNLYVSGLAATITFGSAGSYNVQATALDEIGEVARTNFTVVVWSPVAPLVASLTVASPTTQGAVLSLGASLTGGTPPYEWTWAGLPPGCASANLSQIMCQPSSAGSFTPTLRVTDSLGQIAEASGSLRVNDPPRIDARIQKATTFCSVLGPKEDLTINATVNGGTPPYRFEWSVGNGPAVEGGYVFEHVFAYESSPIQLTITDSVLVNASVVIPVPPLATVLCTTSPTPPSAHLETSDLVVGLAVASAGIVGTLSLVWNLRRSRRP